MTTLRAIRSRLAFGTPIGLLSNVDLVNTTTTTGEDNEGATTT